MANEKPINPIYNYSLQQLLSIQTLSIATGTSTTVNQAPAVASIITAADIQAMGATQLHEVLEQVPGLHIMPSRLSRLDTMFEIRGIQGGQNATILLLLDGIEIKNTHSGGLPFTFKFPLTNVKQIEVLRGPGSAIYGADAFSGVINIITKTHKENVTEVGFNHGSFNTHALWLNSQYQTGDLKLALALDQFKSTGDKQKLVEIDAQTGLDAVLGTNASLAPGYLPRQYDIANVQLNLNYKGIKLENWWWKQTNAGLGAGGAQALDHSGTHNGSVYRHALSYQWGKQSDITYHLSGYFQEMTNDTLFYLFPAGVQIPIDSNGNINFINAVNLVTFEDGFIGRPIIKNQDANLNAILNYQRIKDHQIRVNIGVTSHLSRVKELKNFGPTILDGTQTTVSGLLTDVSYTDYAFMPTMRRNIRYLSLQDQWQYSQDISLVTGLRFDHYSDFGSTVNPRVALVWQTNERLTSKLLYGTAYRAPSFSEQGIRNNPVYHGNTNLNPETISTFELAFDYQLSEQSNITASLFDYRAKDLIILEPDDLTSALTNQNAANQKGHGFELEAQIKLNSHFTIKTNYSQQISTSVIDGSSQTQVAHAPQNTFYLGLDYRLNQHFSAHINTSYIANRAREANSQRKPIDDYWLTAINLQYSPEQWPLTASLRISNLFDSDIREPSNGTIVNDYPMPSKQVSAQLEYRF
jgi:iron complex outermembrane receptor protein